MLTICTTVLTISFVIFSMISVRASDAGTRKHFDKCDLCIGNESMLHLGPGTKMSIVIDGILADFGRIPAQKEGKGVPSSTQAERALSHSIFAISLDFAEMLQGPGAHFQSAARHVDLQLFGVGQHYLVHSNRSYSISFCSLWF